MQNETHKKLLKPSINWKDVQLAGDKLTFKAFSTGFSEQVTEEQHLAQGDTHLQEHHAPSALSFKDRHCYTKPKHILEADPSSSCRCLGGKESL